MVKGRNANEWCGGGGAKSQLESKRRNKRDEAEGAPGDTEDQFRGGDSQVQKLAEAPLGELERRVRAGDASAPNLRPPTLLPVTAVLQTVNSKVRINAHSCCPA